MHSLTEQAPQKNPPQLVPTEQFTAYKIQRKCPLTPPPPTPTPSPHSPLYNLGGTLNSRCSSGDIAQWQSNRLQSDRPLVQIRVSPNIFFFSTFSFYPPFNNKYCICTVQSSFVRIYLYVSDQLFLYILQYIFYMSHL